MASREFPSYLGGIMEDVLILGTGCAGLTAAIYTARANLRPLVLEGVQPGGQLTTTSEVENFPGFPEGVDGFELMDRLRKQATKFGTRFQSDYIERVDLTGPEKILKSATQEYRTRALIIATGASPRMLHVPGEKEMFGGKGVTTCATCDGAFYRGMEVAVAGGGDSACEEALFLTRFCTKVYLIHRRSELRASDIMAKRTLEHPKIQPVWDTQIVRVLADEKGHVRGLALQNKKTGAASELAVKGIFVAIGHVPNSQAFVGALPLDEMGYFLPAPGSAVRTKVPGVYVAGDCADHVYRQAITAAGLGCQAAIEAERWLEQEGH
ncbi:MAG TPA: thioredoxin-disulfide reductase [Opitutales bacterium]|nr:thioredoxin-disulfide reductase [Opitutales bacterium]